jgi:3'-5' exoribonuclease
MATAVPLDIPGLSPGSRIQHELLVYERSEKKTNAGDPFVVLKLGNASGTIETAPIWSDKLHWAEGADSGRVVQAIGDITVYARGGTGGKKQLAISAPVRLIPQELVRIDEFLPRITHDVAKLWGAFDKLRFEVESPRLRRVLDLFFADEEFRLAFEQAPGSTGGHHAKIGGLLLHTWEVARIAKTTAQTMRANVDLVVAGALLHDVGKVESYTVGPGGFTFTPCGLLVGHVVLGVMMLERRLAKLGERVCTEGQLLELQHMILSHHGQLEFGSPVTPMTTEAEIVHWADEASAKANDMMESLEDGDAFLSGGELSDKRVWRVGRRVWRRPHGWD